MCTCHICTNGRGTCVLRFVPAFAGSRTTTLANTAATTTSPVANTVGEAATVVLAEGVANLKRPTTLALKCKSTPRNPKCNFLLSSSKCLYHNTKVDKKRNIFVRLTSLGKEKNVITSVALKIKVNKIISYFYYHLLWLTSICF